MVFVAKLFIDGRKVIISRSYSNDQYLLSNAVLGKLFCRKGPHGRNNEREQTNKLDVRVK